MPTLDEILTNLSLKASKQELEALSRQIADLLRLTGADQYYRKPSDGIPRTDLDPSLASKIDEIDNKYTKGQAIETTDLPSNIPTQEDLSKATKGVIYNTIPANRIIDDVMAARDGEASLKANIDLRVLISAIIATVNASAEMDGENPLIISSSKLPIQTHQALPDKNGTDRHSMDDITGLNAAFSNLATLYVAKLAVILAINSSEEAIKILGSKVDFSTVNHNDFGGRDAADAHPVTSITGLSEVLTTLGGQISGLEGTTGQHTLDIACLKQAICSMCTQLMITPEPCLNC